MKLKFAFMRRGDTIRVLRREDYQISVNHSTDNLTFESRVPSPILTIGGWLAEFKFKHAGLPRLLYLPGEAEIKYIDRERDLP